MFDSCQGSVKHYKRFDTKYVFWYPFGVMTPNGGEFMKLSTDDLIEVIRLKEQDKMSSRPIGEIMGVSKTAINNFLARKTYLDFWEQYDEKPTAGGQIECFHTKRGTFKESSG